MTFDRFDVVVVPFPFSDRAITRRRPALVLSDAPFAEHSGSAILAMITSARQSDWPGDTPVTDRDKAGLAVPCKVRLKLFTLDTRLILQRVGRLGEADRTAVRAALKDALPL